MDLITYVPSLTAMNLEGQSIAADPDHELADLFSIDDDGALTFNVVKIPVHYTNEGETLCVVRGVDRDTIEKCSSIQVLGVVDDGEYVFDSDDAQTTYERVRGELEFSFINEDGSTQTAQKPYKIGVFA